MFQLTSTLQQCSMKRVSSELRNLL